MTFKPFACAFSGLLTIGCSANLPDTPSTRAATPIVEAASDRAFALCETLPNATTCLPSSKGITAGGVGGLFLPLNAVVETIAFDNESAQLQLKVNNIAATCSRGRVEFLESENSARVRDIVCNWLVVGNVVATVTFSLDWIDGNTAFGGRFAMTFSGTGNGAGSGHFKAEVQQGLDGKT